MSRQEKLRELAERVKHRIDYPLGRPYPVAVTLTDEQWNALSTYLEIALTLTKESEDPSVIPEEFRELAISGGREIQRVNLEVAAAELMGGPREEGR